MKLTNYSELLGKTIVKIEDDFDVVRLTFSDGSYADIKDSYDGSIELDDTDWKSEINDPIKTYEL